MNLLQDPDYALTVRVEDMGGDAPNALKSTTRVNIVILQNLWVKPRPIKLRENLEGEYPMFLATVSLDLKTMMLLCYVGSVYTFNFIHIISNNSLHYLLFFFCNRCVPMIPPHRTGWYRKKDLPSPSPSIKMEISMSPLLWIENRKIW